MNQTFLSATRLQKTNRLICFVSVFLLLGIKINAQTLSIASGISIPSGLYSSKDFTQKDCGLAKTGYSINLVFEDNRKTRAINPIIQYTFNSNPLDQDAIEKYVKVLDPKVIGLQSYKPWSQHLLMIGAKANYYNSNYTLFAKASAGLGWLSTFGYTYYDTLSGYDIIKRKVANENSLVMSIGVGGNVMIFENIDLNFGYDFFYSKSNFGKPSYVDSSGKPIGTSESYSPPFQTASIYLGLSFHLRGAYQKK
ncbi:MAG: hypothetical protein CFE21_06290 [Bacteroidetes bacterium B1(2017)]|nr:MAG: hypothetical protein CFE21_06290 [Bacteroidetes bacterium B1(2017)]